MNTSRIYNVLYLFSKRRYTVGHDAAAIAESEAEAEAEADEQPVSAALTKGRVARASVWAGVSIAADGLRPLSSCYMMKKSKPHKITRITHIGIQINNCKKPPDIFLLLFQTRLSDVTSII